MEKMGQDLEGYCSSHGWGMCACLEALENLGAKTNS